ncbi:MAG: hypothetical protein R3B54_07760 [Bdellovibrionota bacterium]
MAFYGCGHHLLGSASDHVSGIAKTHFEKPVHSLGGSVLAGQLYLIEQKGSDDEIIDNLRWYNLFRKPVDDMRTSAPAPVSLAMSTPGGTVMPFV